MIESLKTLLATSEEWLMHRVLDYAKRQDYTRYTSTLAEAWRVSIAGLTETITEALQRHDVPPELHPDEDYANDPIAAFGMLEARRHRERGVRLDMFLGLMKYYKQAYVDRIRESDLEQSVKEPAERFVIRCFDRLEIGFCQEWVGQSQEALIMELQARNREMTNEKNKYLTLFESLSTPVFLLDQNHRIENMNHMAAELFFRQDIPGMEYYDEFKSPKHLAWAVPDLQKMDREDLSELEVENKLPTCTGERTFKVLYQRMLDVSDKFIGTVVVTEDLTKEHEIQAQLRELILDKDVLLQEVHHRVKNNFLIISSLLSLHAEQIADPEAKLHFKEAQDRLRAMMIVHQQLYSSGDVSRVNLPEYTEMLVRDLMQSYQADNTNIDLQVSLAPCRIPTKKAIPYGLILNELITNAVKYAFPDRREGKIQIRSEIKNDHITLQVCDNGVGMPEDLVIENCASLGLRLVQMLTQQLRGSLTITRKSGTCFTIQFPG